MRAKPWPAKQRGSVRRCAGGCTGPHVHTVGGATLVCRGPRLRDQWRALRADLRRWWEM